ncbi:MAG: dihydrofolate reductase [DPANN group archaeon]|nr:dihydrofolate reductase [DPANN group archaeon]
MPNYTAYAAMTLDGKIAREEQEFVDWTSKEDADHYQASLKKHDVIIVGNNTYQTAIENLSRRNCIVLTRRVTSPERENERLVWFNAEHDDLDAYVREQGYVGPAIIGGSKVYAALFGLIDHLYLTIEPLVFGSGIPLTDGRQIGTAMKLASLKQLNEQGTLLLHYVKAEKKDIP